ncbi:LysR family transcriptional regulator [Pseudomonas alloputida]|uniref:Transcriptional regulator, LysR family n=1 Tax=Pseudomonas putida (strain ATCC 700007 / DSM 6899 / JCM 31910 / BCRC 17059 / LMG 24140 / F1) TaxID=351746 RepID=A5W064_PSEP1|nr:MULTISPECIES: LysR family transcriptional regulator [Pseudomonas]MDD2000049.1 LysR family transcriptional regulator [Pseudomonas putida]MPT20796.1 LysR family transcriptional regulator [Pseudomonas sp.]HDS1789260.1 LysR family transcriptional regulator [Pseudomonas putida]
MDLKQLECFVRVAEFGGFTKASATLNLSQSVVSRQVRQLEVELQQHLLQRNGRGVTLTPAGARLFEHGQGILRQLQVAREDLQEQRDSPNGKVVIGLPPSIARRHTVGIVTEFQRLFPGCALGIKEGLSHSMREWLLLGRLDFALLYNPAQNSQLSFEPVQSEPLWLVSSANMPLPAEVELSTLGDYPLIIPSQPHSLRRLIESEAARYQVELNVRLEIDGIFSLLDLVAIGAGHAVLSQVALEGPYVPPGLHSAPIVNPTINTHLFVATANQRPLTRLAALTLGMVRGQMG